MEAGCGILEGKCGTARLTNQVIGFQGRQAWVGETEDLVIIHDTGLNMNQQADLSPKGKNNSSLGGTMGLVPSLTPPAPDSAAEVVSHPLALSPHSQPLLLFLRLLALSCTPMGLRVCISTLSREASNTDPS